MLEAAFAVRVHHVARLLVFGMYLKRSYKMNIKYITVIQYSIFYALLCTKKGILSVILVPINLFKKWLDLVWPLGSPGTLYRFF